MTVSVECNKDSTSQWSNMKYVEVGEAPERFLIKVKMRLDDQ